MFFTFPSCRSSPSPRLFSCRLPIRVDVHNCKHASHHRQFYTYWAWVPIQSTSFCVMQYTSENVINW